MNKSHISLILIMLCQPLFSSDAAAQGKWWEKASSLFKNQEVVKPSNEPSLGEIGDAFKQALRIGSETVVTKLGSEDGFNADPAIHIPLPSQLQSARSMLAKVGMSGLVDDLELKLNRAAEVATPMAKQLFLQSISDMTFADVKTIYDGPDDSATRYFQDKMSQPLADEMRPIVDNSLSEVGAVQSYDKVMRAYKALPFVPDLKADLSNHVVEKGMEGIFYYLAKEEAAIRANPAKQTTDLLKKVFGLK